MVGYLSMEGVPEKEESVIAVREGLVDVIAEPTGGDKGPGSKAPVFYNPAMTENRDLSIVVVQTLIDSGHFGDRERIDLLDGLTGSGIRAVRFALELDGKGSDIAISGVDLKSESVESANHLAALNGADVNFMNTDLNLYCGNRRFDYIDVDPFGSPVPFLQTSLRSLKKNGILAVTATDTAALTGSVPRVARRRYGVKVSRTHFMQEMGCRVLMGYLARLAATFEISVEPLLLYSSDHFLRGYVRIDKGAKKADRCLDSLNWLVYRIPHPPRVLEKPWDADPKERYQVLGPVWTGPLADSGFCRNSIDVLERFGSGQIRKYGSIEKMLNLSIREERFPPGGFDVNETASLLGTSPPSMQKISGTIEEHGYDWSRSRFSPTIIKTDAGQEIIEASFKSGGPE